MRSRCRGELARTLGVLGKAVTGRQHSSPDGLGIDRVPAHGHRTAREIHIDAAHTGQLADVLADRRNTMLASHARNVIGLLITVVHRSPFYPKGTVLRFASARPLAARSRQVATAPLAAAIILALAGCGANGSTSGQGSSTSTEPSYVSEPFTHQQRLVEQGARLVVSDGCSACHLLAHGRRLAPSFSSFAGNRVTLADGHRVLVDERFLREALLHPSRTQIKGYDPGPMLTAISRLHLASHPQQVAALAAFIEQIGPEP